MPRLIHTLPDLVKDCYFFSGFWESGSIPIGFGPKFHAISRYRCSQSSNGDPSRALFFGHFLNCQDVCDFQLYSRLWGTPTGLKNMVSGVASNSQSIGSSALTPTQSVSEIIRNLVFNQILNQVLYQALIRYPIGYLIRYLIMYLSSTLSDT